MEKYINLVTVFARRAWSGLIQTLLDVVLGPPLPPRPQRQGQGEDLGLWLLFRRPSLWVRRFWSPRNRR